jgi:putative peptide zinc metalloprotease protein
MSESLFSQHWFRISELHPQLRSHVHLERHCYRDEVWYVLKDPISGRTHRVNSSAYHVVGRLDGRRSVQEIWDTCIEQLGEAAPSQGEMIELLGTLGDAELIQTEATPDVAQLFARREKRVKAQAKQKLNPLAFKVALGNPSKLLDIFVPLFSSFLKPGVGIFCLLSSCVALLFAGTNWNEIQTYSKIHLQSPRMLVLLWLAYPIAKLLHEFAHGLTVRAWGGDVKEFGVTLLAFFPVPYVDVSSASGFRSKHQRVFVSLIGVMSELIFAALAFCLWLNISEGLLREFCFAVMTTCTISTLLVNGNPLMKFDAYYALADQLESPGLANRSNALLLHYAQKTILGVQDTQAPTVASGERGWLIAYGTTAFIYRIVVCVGLGTWIASFSLSLAIAFFAWSGFTLLLQPLFSLAKFLLSSPSILHRSRAILGALSIGIFLTALLGWLPLPHSTQSEGVVWIPEESRLRAQSEGFVQKVLIADQTRVSKGDAIIQMDDPVLRSDYLRAQARLDALEANYQLALSKLSSETAPLKDDIDRLKQEIARYETRIEQLTLRATSSGTLALSRAADLAGAYLAKGSVIGHVIEPGKTVIRAVLTQSDVGLVRDQTTKIQVRLAEHNFEPREASIMNQTPASTRELPSAALGDKGGGTFVTDPSDEHGLQLQLPVFVVDVLLNDEPLKRIGGRAWVLFDHGSQPLAFQWARSIRQVFLKHLGNDRA